MFPRNFYIQGVYFNLIQQNNHPVYTMFHLKYRKCKRPTLSNSDRGKYIENSSISDCIVFKSLSKTLNWIITPSFSVHWFSNFKQAEEGSTLKNFIIKFAKSIATVGKSSGLLYCNRNPTFVTHVTILENDDGVQDRLAGIKQLRKGFITSKGSCKNNFLSNFFLC